MYENTKRDQLRMHVVAVSEPRMWLQMNSKAAIPLQLNVGQSRGKDHLCCVLYGLYCQISFVFLSIRNEIS